MKKLVLSLLVAVLPLALFGASGTAIPGGNQATAFIINKPGAYYLAANRVMTTKAYGAIQINASDVTLDLNGFTLSFSDADGGTANGITTGGSNVEIRNGSITVTPHFAIKAYGSGLRIIDVRMDDTEGIYSEAEAALVERCHVVDSRSCAIHMAGWGSIIKDCIIRNVIQKNGSFGVGIRASSYGEVVGNSINYTASAGIECGGTGATVKNNRVLQANQAHLNWCGGILAFGAQMYISGNVIDRTAGQGIKVAYDSCLIEGNVVKGTEKVGMFVGAGIVSDKATTIVRGNLGSRNPGGLVVGPHIDGGSNMSN
jgi:hypothetical protein